MQTEDAKVVDEAKGVFVNLPLTKPTGKIRVKRRSVFSEYGLPVRPRQDPLTQTNYVEWQIGYDLLANEENQVKTSLADLTFENYKGETKFAYELSEIVFYAKKHGLLDDAAICDCYENIRSVKEIETFEATADITRTNPKIVQKNGLEFYEMHVSYPLFVHRFGQYEIYAEIVIREKQKAVGTQAMLYVCLPVMALKFAKEPIGRVLAAKECGEWHIGKEEAGLALELFRVFGMLSPKHRHDVLAILEMLFPSSILGTSSTRSTHSTN